MANLPHGYKDPIKYAAYLERQKIYKQNRSSQKISDYHLISKDKYRERNLQRDYGISVSAYEDLLKGQGDVCKICNKPETSKLRGVTKNLAVDHCHKTGKIRGLLCSNCNRGLGLLQDSEEILSKAISYLKG